MRKINERGTARGRERPIGRPTTRTKDKGQRTKDEDEDEDVDVDEHEAAIGKRQAASGKRQAASGKQQAASGKRQAAAIGGDLGDLIGGDLGGLTGGGDLRARAISRCVPRLPPKLAGGFRRSAALWRARGGRAEGGHESVNH